MDGVIVKPPRQPQWMVVAINLAIMVAYTIYNKTLDMGADAVLGVAMLIGLHVGLCLLSAIFIFRKEFLLSAAMVLVVGFSTCWLVFAT
jgi:hypothetical protein